MNHKCNKTYRTYTNIHFFSIGDLSAPPVGRSKSKIVTTKQSQWNKQTRKYSKHERKSKQKQYNLLPTYRNVTEIEQKQNEKSYC